MRFTHGYAIVVAGLGAFFEDACANAQSIVLTANQDILAPESQNAKDIEYTEQEIARASVRDLKGQGIGMMNMMNGGMKMKGSMGVKGSSMAATGLPTLQPTTLSPTVPPTTSPTVLPTDLPSIAPSSVSPSVFCKPEFNFIC